MGRAANRNDHERALRGEVTGWSQSAARRNLKFLRSVEPDDLTGKGYTATFTLRDCPESKEQWKRLREALFMRFTRMGLLRGHWVTEWQRRGVPHLHGIFFFPDDAGADMGARMVTAWCEIAAAFGAGVKGQHVREVTHIIGWFKYLAKHASRGYKHYQRARENVPEGWKKTGRVWGYIGDWPLVDEVRYQVDERAYFWLRRRAQRYVIANARAAMREASPYVLVDKGSLLKFVEARRTLVWARRMWRHGDGLLSRLRGVSEWMPKEQIDALILWMLAAGFVVRKDGERGVVVSVDGMTIDPETGEILDGM